MLPTRHLQLIVIVASVLGALGAWLRSPPLMAIWLGGALGVMLMGFVTKLSPIIALRVAFIIVGLQVPGRDQKGCKGLSSPV